MPGFGVEQQAFAMGKRSAIETAKASMGPHGAVVPKPTDEANRCILGHGTPKTLRKALYVGSSQVGRPLQVLCLGWSQFPIPEARLAGYAGPIYRLTPCGYRLGDRRARA